MTRVIKPHASGYKMIGVRFRKALFPLPLSLGQCDYARMPGANVWVNVRCPSLEQSALQERVGLIVFPSVPDTMVDVSASFDSLKCQSGC